AERLAMRSERYGRAGEYWMQRIDSLPGGPELPIRSVGGDGARRFTRRIGSLARDEWSRLKEASAAAGLTPAVLSPAAYAKVPASWSRNPRFCVNLTLFRRLPVHP